MTDATDDLVAKIRGRVRDNILRDGLLMMSSLCVPHNMIAALLSRLDAETARADRATREAKVSSQLAYANNSRALKAEAENARLAAELAEAVPPHPEDYDHAALLISNDYKRTRWVVVPEGQSLDFDEGKATRAWLHPHLGREWHLFGFVPLHPPKTARAWHERNG